MPSLVPTVIFTVTSATLRYEMLYLIYLYQVSLNRN